MQINTDNNKSDPTYANSILCAENLCSTNNTHAPKASPKAAQINLAPISKTTIGMIGHHHSDDKSEAEAP